MRILDRVATVLWLVFWFALAITMAQAGDQLGIWTAQPGNTAAAPDNPRCRESAFLFSKIAVGMINCNLPRSPMLSVFGDTAKHFCGPGEPSKWPGAMEGAGVMLKELEHDRAGTCARLAAEMRL